MKISNRFFHSVLISLPPVCALAIAPGAWAHHGPGADHMFQMMDTDGDGKISAEEHAAGAKKMFERMDANKDGKVTAAEMDAAHEQMTGKGKKSEMKSEKPEMKSEMSSADKIKAVDTNNDGVLSEEEHVAGAKMMFDKMDTDHDGFLTKAEMEAGHAKMMSKAH